MSQPFYANFQVAWRDLDANGHMANAAFLDYATQARFLYIAAEGFTPADFRRHGVGPVVLEDRIRYIKELLFLEEFRIDFATGEFSDDDARFSIRNRFLREDVPCAEILSRGTWFDLRRRKVTPPPPELAALMRRAPRID